MDIKANLLSRLVQETWTGYMNGSQNNETIFTPESVPLQGPRLDLFCCKSMICPVPLHLLNSQVMQSCCQRPPNELPGHGIKHLVVTGYKPAADELPKSTAGINNQIKRL